MIRWTPLQSIWVLEHGEYLLCYLSTMFSFTPKILSVGLFASEDGMKFLHPDTTAYGLFYGVTIRFIGILSDLNLLCLFIVLQGGGEQLGIQILGLVVVVAWTAVTAAILFKVLHKFHVLRIDASSELVGIDNVDYGGSAYPNFMQV